PQELLQRVHGVWQTEAQQQQIALRQQAAVDLPTIDVDPERMMQVLNNLVGNALRHTPSGGQITLTAGRDGASVVLAVRDNGRGIAKEQLPLVFERFYRVDPDHAEAAGGTGLGLAIARSIVETHGGTLSATSDGLGHGTTFEIRLPCAT
ncbi:MAG: ATP-binding protein, partial [Caldilineaceae bacterium]|nr:ATP-binding protein [Caldilineaceae bacterium]